VSLASTPTATIANILFIINASGSAFTPSMTIAISMRNVVQMIGASAVFLNPDELALLTAVTDAAALIIKAKTLRGLPGAAPGGGIDSGL
jgi:hypothetical protein